MGLFGELVLGQVALVVLGKLTQNLSLVLADDGPRLTVAADSQSERLALEIDQSWELQVVQKVVDDGSHFHECIEVGVHLWSSLVLHLRAGS